MNKLALLSLIAATTLISTAHAGDPVAGQQKATACMACHGSDSFGGIFYTLQLGGRDADKLFIKTMKYKNGKVLHPMMNVATAFFTEKEIEDISAYYKSLGKPAFSSPLFNIKGDDADKPTEVAATPVVAPTTAPMTAPATYPTAMTPAATSTPWGNSKSGY
jgi:cytochrome c553